VTQVRRWVRAITRARCQNRAVTQACYQARAGHTGPPARPVPVAYTDGRAPRRSHGDALVGLNRGAALTRSQGKPDRHDRPRDATGPAPMATGVTTGPAAVTTLPAQFDEWQIELHGRRVIYRVAGS